MTTLSSKILANYEAAYLTEMAQWADGLDEIRKAIKMPDSATAEQVVQAVVDALEAGRHHTAKHEELSKQVVALQRQIENLKQATTPSPALEAEVDRLKKALESEHERGYRRALKEMHKLALKAAKDEPTVDAKVDEKDEKEVPLTREEIARLPVGSVIEGWRAGTSSWVTYKRTSAAHWQGSNGATHHHATGFLEGVSNILLVKEGSGADA